MVSWVRVSVKQGINLVWRGADGKMSSGAGFFGEAGKSCRNVDYDKASGADSIEPILFSSIFKEQTNKKMVKLFTLCNDEIVNDEDVVVSLVATAEELRDKTFSGSDNEDANEHIEKFLEIVDLFHIPNITQDQFVGAEVILFYKGMQLPTRQILDSKGFIPSMKVPEAKKAIQEIANHS
uniref:Uncharacterized protein n=1 Tax=Tanacetum cinerariifolium TaxID=118510 RepID=A0A6L2KE28_TANCI|nr:hypothetical protein [Tanacetum cinerariifolium]